MKKIFSLFTAFVITSVISGTAYGDDVAYTDWSGPYGGLIIARNMGSSAITDPTNYAFFDSEDGKENLHPEGNYGGIELGFNWQYDAAVFGVEADYAFGSAKDTTATAYPGSVRWNDISTLRARAGYASTFGLLYLTGGLAMTDMDSKVFYDPLPCWDTGTACDSRLRIGAAFGAGIETKIDQQVSLKLEYNYIDFKDLTLSNNDGFFYTFQNRSDVIKLGVNYHF